MSKANIHRRTVPMEYLKVSAPAILKGMGFMIGKTIGQGTYSKVCLTVTNSGDRIACKIINKRFAGSDFIKRFLPREIQVVSMIEHSNIVNVFKIIEINNIIYMFMDYCRNGDLLEYVRNNGPLSEERAKYYFRQIVAGVEYLHNLDVAHRDLKCENILITANNTIKIGDFGFARLCNDPRTGEKVLSDTFCGSAAYAAPEILQGVSYDPKMFDIWAMGCILYIMLSASMPFDDSNIKRMIKTQLNRSISVTAFSMWTENTTALKNLLAYLLEPNVQKRATIKQIVNSFWLQDTALKKCKHILMSISDTNLF